MAQFVVGIVVGHLAKLSNAILKLAHGLVRCPLSVVRCLTLPDYCRHFATDNGRRSTDQVAHFGKSMTVIVIFSSTDVLEILSVALSWTVKVPLRVSGTW